MFLDLLYYPDGWYDNRPQVAPSKRPDFSKKGDFPPETLKPGLWLEDPSKCVACAVRRLACLTPLSRPSRLPAFVRDYFGHRGQDPPPQWTPPQPDEDYEGDADASQGSNVAPF
jgi:hypothetical protein